MGRKPQPSSKPVPDFLVKKDRGVNPRGIPYDREINDQMESLKNIGQFAWESLPGIGTAYTVQDIKDELAKEEPNYFVIGALAGSEVIGLIPGLGPAAKKAIKKGAKSAGKLGSKIDRAVDQTTALLGGPKAKDSVKTEIIAGPGAKSYYNRDYDRAKELKEQGYSAAQIEDITGRVETGESTDYLGATDARYSDLKDIRDDIKLRLSFSDLSPEARQQYEKQLLDIEKGLKLRDSQTPGGIRLPESPFKFEIDDSRIEIRSNDGNQTLKESTKHKPIIVRNIIPTHTELFKEYPDLESVEFYVDPDLDTGAHFNPTVGKNGAIVLGSNRTDLSRPNSKRFRNTFFHELQHAAQYQDYKIANLFQLGGGPTQLGRNLVRGSQLQRIPLEQNPNLVNLRDEILEIFEAEKNTGALDTTSPGFRLPGTSPNPAKVFGDVDVAKKLARKMRELESELFKSYMRSASEIEARLAGKRGQEIATVGSNTKPRITSDLAKERRVETKEEFWSDNPKSDADKKKADIKIKLGPMTNEEVLRYATGAINFARYAKGIDKELQGFSDFGPTKANYAKGGLTESKGLSWGELIVDNILGLDNEYESFGEKLGKAINEDEIKFLKDAAVGVYEGTKEFVQAPVETTKQVVNQIKDSVTRLGSEDLNTRLQRMYGVSYDQATDEQVNQAREAVLGDALTALELVPAAKGATAVAKAGIAAVPGGLKADVIGQTKAMLSGDREFLSGTPTPKADAQPAGAQVPGMFDRKTPEEMQDYQKSVFDPTPDESNPAKLLKELQDDINMSVYDFGIGSDGFLNTAFTPVKIRHGSKVNMKVPIERYLRETGLYGRLSEVAQEVPAKSYLPPSIILDDFNEMVVDDIVAWYNEMLPHMLADASPEKIFRLAAHLNMYPDRDWRREENRSLIEELAEEIYDEIDTSSNFSTLKITNPTTLFPSSAKKSEKLKFSKLGNDNTGRLVVRPIKPDVNDKYEFYDILGDGADEFKDSLKPYLAEGIIDFLENNFERYIPETLVNPSTGTSTTRENLLRGVRQEWEQGPNFDLDPLDTLKEIEFKNLGEELLENFKSRVGNKEFVTGAEVLKVLENDPRMNPKTIPNWMKTTEYKNKKIPVADLQGTIDYYSATSPQVSLKNKRSYTGYQRQFGQGFVGGEFKDYVEIIPSTSEKQTLFSDVYSHYGPRALSHTRATVLNKSDATWKPREAEILGDDDYMMVEEFQSDLVQQGSQNKKNIEYSPIKKSQEALELNIQSLIAEASKRGITKIVIPPFSKIAAARLMGERLDLALKNKSRSRKTGEIVDGNLFYRIYVTELNKALDKFEKSYPITVHRNVELPYQGRPGSTRPADADELDEFFNLPDDDEIFDAGPDDAQQALVDAELEDQLLNDIAEMMDEDGNITDQILKEYEEPKPEFIGGGYILDISQMDKEFKLQEPKFAEGGTVEPEWDLSSREYDGEEVNVITFKDGKELNMIEIHRMFEKHHSALEPIPGPETSKEILNFLKERNPTREEFIRHFSAKRLNKGGINMNQQMSFAFEDGGLRDDGMMRDPVSGNEVPPGSTAREVRDDIPAQLSEGEYVVPADVVRYYGVKFFEDLRDNAKMGLQDMESRGRIGGEPVPAGGPMNEGDLSPEEMAAIQEMMGMAEGGTVNMYKQQQDLYTAPNPAIGNSNTNYAYGGVVGYAPGGLQAANEQGIYTAGQQAQQAGFTGFPLGSTIFPTQAQLAAGQTTPAFDPTASQDIITLYSPDGKEVRTLNLAILSDREEYSRLLSEGWSTQQLKTTTETAVGRDDGNDQSKPKITPEPLDVSKIKTEDLAKTAKGLGTMTTIATALASTAGLPVAAFINTKMVAQYNDIVKRMDEEGINTDGLKPKGSIFGGESSLYDNLADLDGDGKKSFGDTWLGDLLGFDGEAGIAEGNPGLRDSFRGARRTGGDSDDDGGTPAVASASNNNNNKSPSASAKKSTAEAEKSTAGLSETEKQGGSELDTSMGITGLDKGGLMAKGKKKKK